jgi:hypothetical protein
MDLYRTRICLSLRSHIFRKCFGMYGGDDGARTRDLCRDSLALIGFSTTYRLVRDAEIITGRARNGFLWVGLWVEKYCVAPPPAAPS